MRLLTYPGKGPHCRTPVSSSDVVCPPCVRCREDRSGCPIDLWCDLSLQRRFLRERELIYPVPKSHLAGRYTTFAPIARNCGSLGKPSTRNRSGCMSISAEIIRPETHGVVKNTAPTFDSQLAQSAPQPPSVLTRPPIAPSRRTADLASFPSGTEHSCAPIVRSEARSGVIGPVFDSRRFWGRIWAVYPGEMTQDRLGRADHG